jgi:hypothetical protein
MVYIFLRLTSFMRDAGYHEHSIALWQCLLELTLPKPTDINAANVLDKLGVYWDEEYPRLGELGYLSWKERQDVLNQPPMDPVSIEAEIFQASVSTFAQFGPPEIRTAKKLALPGRTIDDAGEGDPFHVVFFSDLRPLLSPFANTVQDTQTTILGFLRYLGLPELPGTTDYQCLAWWNDPLMTEIQYEADKDWPSAHISNILRDPMPEVFKCRRITTEILFTDAFFGLPSERVEWIEAVLSVLVEKLPFEENFVEYYLAYLYHVNPLRYELPTQRSMIDQAKLIQDSASKAAKRFAKTHSACLRLYNAVGLIESRRGKDTVADQVFSTTIKLSKTLSEGAQHETVLLWRSWVWECLQRQRIDKGVDVLRSLGDEQFQVDKIESSDQEAIFFHPTTALKIRQTLKSGIAESISAQDGRRAGLFAELLAIFQYLNSGFNLDLALHALDETSHVLGVSEESPSVWREVIAQKKAMMIDYHIGRANAFQPEQVRQLLLPMMADFPTNTVVMSTLTRVEAKIALNDRIRAALSNAPQLNRDFGIIQWLYWIRHEMNRDPQLGGTTNSIRSILEKAVECRR